MNNVVTVQKLKKDWLQIRIREEVKEDFAIAAELRGASMSGLVLQFIMKTIREERAQSPEAFTISERKAHTNLEPTPNMKIALVEDMGELTDERKAKRAAKPIKKRAGR